MIRNAQRLVFFIAVIFTVSTAYAVGPLVKDVPTTTYTVGGMTTCTAAKCTKCGNTFDGKATCTLVTSSSSCECQYNDAYCTGTGTCTYRA
jgi:hypothetical protein